MDRWRVALQLSASGLDRSIAAALLCIALVCPALLKDRFDTIQGEENGLLNRAPGTDMYLASERPPQSALC